MYEKLLNKKNTFMGLYLLNPEDLGPFSLSPLACEAMMVKEYGVDISDTKYIKSITNDEKKQIMERIPCFIADEDERGDELTKMLAKYKEIKGPSSMIVNSVKELYSHVLTAYKASHAHSILAKNRTIKFPYGYCGISSRNVMFSLMELGYPNAVYAYNRTWDHGYVLMPFIMEYGDLKGTILTDPTSDQLYKNLKKKPRNVVPVLFFDSDNYKYKYITEWLKRDNYAEKCDGGNNLFPNSVMDISTLRYILEHNIEFGESRIYNYQDGEKYLKDAFSNPINITNHN
ncbi:MAG: hypothetical protein U9Q92_00555 [archaeon]|nr:hypothetical protein [archaeon]